MELILYKTPEHSFKYMLGALLMEAEHLPIQAEQCILIANNTGQCTIKQGELDKLLEIKSGLEKRKLKVEIV